MKKGKELFIGTSIGVIIGFLLFMVALGTTGSPRGDVVYEGIRYYATVCPTITRADGSIEVIECTHNVLTYTGMNATRDLLGKGSAGTAFKYIGLECGSNIPGVTNTSLVSECAQAGLTRGTGIFLVDPPENRTWNIYNKFTLTGSASTVNGAGLFNATSADTMLAVANFTTVASMDPNDELTVNWTISVS